MLGPISVLLRFDKAELLRNVFRGMRASKEGATTCGWYSGVVGKRNYSRILAPFLSAVPSQNVDSFPAAGPGSLFKKRARRKDVVKSFTLDGGLVLGGRGRGRGARHRDRAPARWCARCAGAAAGTRSGSPTGARSRRRWCRWRCRRRWRRRCCAPTSPTSRPSWRAIGMAATETVGVVVRREKVKLPEMAFLVPADDLFWSAVTRDPVPDPDWRAFAFHFKTGKTDEERRARIAADPAGGAGRLRGGHPADDPAPVAGPRATTGSWGSSTGCSSGSRLALTGNYFEGLAIEDCVQRSRAEWARVSAPA